MGHQQPPLFHPGAAGCDGEWVEAGAGDHHQPGLQPQGWQGDGRVQEPSGQHGRRRGS